MSNVFVIPKKSYTQNDIEPVCIKDSCESKKCSDDYFKVENLFSELISEYQRKLARANLGIAEGSSILWGNIKGNLLNQTDLYNFVINSINDRISSIIDNEQLSKWMNEINDALKLKANIESPNLTGEPTAALPRIDDVSSRIATTEWVNAKISGTSLSRNIKSFEVKPSYVFRGDEPVDVTVTWEYNKDVDSQILNDITLDPDIRTYTFKDVSNSFTIILSYKYEDREESKSAYFEVAYPVYYGIINDYTKLPRTKNSTFNIQTNENEYAYIFSPRETEIKVDGIAGGFIVEETKIIHNITYYVYRSYYPNLGLLHIQL